MTRGRLLLCQFAVAAIAIGLWQVLATVPIYGVTLLPPFFFSTPYAVFARIVKWFSEGTIWHHLGITLLEVRSWPLSSAHWQAR